MELVPLVCLCLLSCSGETSAAGDGPVVVTVEEGSDAMLPCSISTKENIEKLTFHWKKDGLEVFFYQNHKHYNNDGQTGQHKQFEGRVFHFDDKLKHGNASIKITKTQLDDSGKYSCTFPPNRSPSSVTLYVGATPRPFVTRLDETNDWALLQCEAHGDPLPTVEWKDSDNNTLNADTPQISDRGGRSYITVKTTVTKTDTYRCVATQETISHRIAAETYVLLNGAASEPSVTILDQTKDWSLLQCVVRGASPKPKVEWRDSSGNVLPVVKPEVTERGDSYDIVLNVTVTKTDRYRCVVTQQEINHQTDAEIYVHMNGSSAGWIVAGVVSLLLVVGGVVAGLYIKHLRKENRQKDEEKREPQSEPNSSTSLKEST